MTWPTVVLVLGCLAFVAALAALAVYLMAVIVRKDVVVAALDQHDQDVGAYWAPPGTRTRSGA